MDGDRPVTRFDSSRWATITTIKVKRIEVEIDGQWRSIGSLTSREPPINWRGVTRLAGCV